MTKCNECVTMYNYVQNDQCPGHIICPNYADGCLWKGPPGFQKTHMENCEYCGDTKIDIYQQDDIALSTSTKSGYLSFYSNLVTALKECSICVVLLVMGMLLSLLIFAIIIFLIFILIRSLHTVWNRFPVWLLQGKMWWRIWKIVQTPME